MLQSCHVDRYCNLTQFPGTVIKFLAVDTFYFYDLAPNYRLEISLVLHQRMKVHVVKDQKSSFPDNTWAGGWWRCTSAQPTSSGAAVPHAATISHTSTAITSSLQAKSKSGNGIGSKGSTYTYQLSKPFLEKQLFGRLPRGSDGKHFLQALCECLTKKKSPRSCAAKSLFRHNSYCCPTWSLMQPFHLHLTPAVRGFVNNRLVTAPQWG